MTEDQWLKASEPDLLLNWLHEVMGLTGMQTNERNLASPRQCRLFACACCRLIWHWLSESERGYIQVAEAYADGKVKQSSLARVCAKQVSARLPAGVGHYASVAVTWALKLPSATNPDLSSPEILARWAAEYSRRLPIENHAKRQVALLRDIIPNPYRPVKLEPAWLKWNGGVIRKLAESIYDERNYEQLPILADALEDARCTNEDLVKHCRSKGPHVRGCWAVDLLLGKR